MSRYLARAFKFSITGPQKRRLLHLAPLVVASRSLHVALPKAEVRVWVGKVMGSEDDIEQALVRLGRAPANAEELQKVIGEIYREQMERVSMESRDCFY